MRNEKYEPIKFNSWQELAKCVIDGGEVWARNNIGQYARIVFDGEGFNCDVRDWVENTFTKKQQTLEELIAIKPRLCWVWDSGGEEKEVALIRDVGVPGKRRYVCVGFMPWDNAQILTDDEIKQFLDKEPS